mmetsp:Transcript_27475/g.20635  ORF Transcript_27475/g.20635 Transcript_27475/m.20635 type:complete len:91 (+) Transcript_27475:286-558(+)
MVDDMALTYVKNSFHAFFFPMLGMLKSQNEPIESIYALMNLSMGIPVCLKGIASKLAIPILGRRIAKFVPTTKIHSYEEVHAMRVKIGEI